MIFWVMLMAMLVNPLVLVGYHRRYPGQGLFKAMVAGFLAGLTFLLVTLPLLQDAWPRACSVVLIYLNFTYIFFHFNNMGETARRIRLVRELAAAPGATLSRQQLRQRYPAREIVERRLQRMMAAGQVVRQGERLQLRAKTALRVAHLLDWLKSWVLPPAR